MAGVYNGDGVTGLILPVVFTRIMYTRLVYLPGLIFRHRILT